MLLVWFVWVVLGIEFFGNVVEELLVGSWSRWCGVFGFFLVFCLLFEFLV